MNAPHISWPLSLVGRWHRSLVFDRRARVLAGLLAKQLPPNAVVLDVGCGDGTVGNLLAKGRPDISIQGVEIAPRMSCLIPCVPFNGEKLPFTDGSFDACLFVDVLHHIDDASILLREAARVSRSFVLLKDHLSENSFDRATLRFMDWTGNRPHGVRLPYNYLSQSEWKRLFKESGLEISNWTNDVPLYPFPASLIFGRDLHFVALLRKV